MRIDLEIVKKILDENEEFFREFKKYGKIYLHTTENVSGMLEEMDLEGKKVLSVAGSGDQGLNAYFKGASEVTLFDVNPLALAQAELKLVAAQKLDYPDFFNFFFPSYTGMLTKQTFSRLINDLSDEVAAYYDYLLSRFDGFQLFMKMAHFFLPSKEKLGRINNYMGDENFKILKERIEGKSFKCIEADLTKLVVSVEEMQDVIILSNISDSLEDIWDVNTLKCYKRYIHTLSSIVNKGGIIQCGYIYSSYKNRERTPIFANNELRREIFTEDEFKETEFMSYESPGKCDKAVIFQRKNKRKAS